MRSGTRGSREVTYTQKRFTILKSKVTCMYIVDWSHRCDVCDLPCKSERGVRIHKSAKHKDEKSQDFTGRLADEAFKAKEWEEQQAVRPVV